MNHIMIFTFDTEHEQKFCLIVLRYYYKIKQIIRVKV